MNDAVSIITWKIWAFRDGTKAYSGKVDSELDSVATTSYEGGHHGYTGYSKARRRISRAGGEG